jgi:ABC-2 type transport system ATP-binding protein
MKLILTNEFFIFIFAKRSLQIMSLQINHLSKKFGEQTALNDINITIDKNEIIGLLGPNGAGKSTLMKSIVGALKIDEGEIIFNDKNIVEHEIESKRKIGFLPENNPLYLEMYIKEYLQFVANIHKISQSRVDEVIDLVGITPEKSKKIGQLSKGYKQRVGLAQAIIHQPDLLILDEPTNGLDPNQIIEIRNVIKQIGQEKTVLLSTHIMQEVEALCSRVILIHKGNILQDCPINEFKGKFESLEEAFASYTQTAEPMITKD